jgi:pimeloyl-ACP methyl ester carboxylesterase
MTQFFITSDGTRLAFADQGAGLPLLCLPGLTRTMADFDYLIPHLPPLRLIRMEYRGRGASQWTGAASYTVPQEGKDALELLDHLGLPKAAILGTSRGGLIGMLLAAVAHDRLLGLCLNDVGPEIHRPGLERIFDYVGRNPAAKTHADLAARLTHGLLLLREGRAADALAVFDDIDVYVGQLPPGDQAIVYAIQAANGQKFEADALLAVIDRARLTEDEAALLTP